jgi:Ca-activated chloride channel homolog
MPRPPKILPNWTVVVSALFACAAANAQIRSPQSPQVSQANHPAILVSTEVVRVPVNVTDEHGNFVTGLTAQNFQVFENQRPQQITFFEKQDMPVTVGLLVDHSGSMIGKLPEVAEAVSALAYSSNPQDEMFVVDFGDAVVVEQSNGKTFSNDPRELGQAVSRVSAAGRTALYDAVVEGFERLKLGQSPKKALIIVSDGGDNASHHNYAQVLELARSSRAVIYAIGLVGEPGEEENPKVLERLCKDTGGIAFFPRKPELIVEIANHIAADLRGQYTLGYVPEGNLNGDTYRTIEVKVSAPGRSKMHVRSRPGYSLAKRPDENPSETAP